MSTAIATKWHRPADCSTREPRPPVKRGHRLLTGASQARPMCSLMPREDTAGRRGPPHTGGRWRGMTEPGRWGSNRRELPVCSRSADSSSASAAHEEAASHGRTFVMSRPPGRRRSTRTAADRSGMPEDRRVWHCRNRVVTKPATRPRRALRLLGKSIDKRTDVTARKKQRELTMICLYNGIHQTVVVRRHHVLHFVTYCDVLRRFIG